MWDEDRMRVSTVSKFKHFIVSEIECDMKRWSIVSIYASNNAKDMDILWIEVT